MDGYFQQVRHRLDDDRAAAYDALLAAEAKATAEKKGVHSAKVRVSNPFGYPCVLWLARLTSGCWIGLTEEEEEEED